MNNLTDEQIDKIIKDSFKQDIQISDKANDVFANFKPQTIKETTKDESNIKEEIKQTRKNVIDGLFYKRLNKFLSVAAVSLSVVIVGGTALYFNQDKMQGKKENQGNNTTIVQPKQRYVVKNEPLQFSNEQVVNKIENHYVTAYLVGNSDVGVEFMHDYWDEMKKESVKVSSQIYKVDGIDGNIKDIFIGNACDSIIPYLFILMEDGTGMYVDLHGYYGNTSALYYYATPIEGLADIVGFEEKTKTYSYSTTEYTYVNAIRSDGKRKEIEIGEVNKWDDTSSKTYDKYNEKYIKAHEGGAIPDDARGDFVVDGLHYYTVNDDKYVYCMKEHDVYQVERSTGIETRLATGIYGMVRDNADGRISFYVDSENYFIYELDKNIVFKTSDGNIINEVTKTKNQTETEKQSENNGQESKTGDNTSVSINYADFFGELKNKTYKNNDYDSSTKDVKEYCTIIFDESGKPEIKFGYFYNNADTEVATINKISNVRSNIAAGTTYIIFDVEFDDVKGTAQISYSNVDDSDTIYLKMELTDNSGKLEQYNIELSCE